MEEERLISVSNAYSHERNREGQEKDPNYSNYDEDHPESYLKQPQGEVDNTTHSHLPPPPAWTSTDRNHDHSGNHNHDH